MSLSPNLSSAMETVSFSLTTGTTPHCRSSPKVFLALSRRSLALKSSRVRRTWAVCRPCRRKAASQQCMTLAWPTAAAACLAAMPLVSWSMPASLRTLRPAATAAEVTSTTVRRPPSGMRERAPIWAARESMTSRSSPSGPAMTALPTLNTMQRASARMRRFASFQSAIDAALRRKLGRYSVSWV